MIKISVANLKKQICSRLATADQGAARTLPMITSGKANGIGQGGNTGRGPASKRGMYPS